MRNQLSQKLTWSKIVDLQKGLIDFNNTTAIPVPAVLIHLGSIKWSDYKRGMQAGEIIVSVFAYFMIGNLFDGAASESESLSILDFTDDIVDVLSHFAERDTFQPLVRVAEETFTKNKYLVVRLDFATVVFQRLEQTLTPLPPARNIDPSIGNTNE